MEGMLARTGAPDVESPGRSPDVRGVVLKARLSLLCRMVTFREPPAPHIYSRFRDKSFHHLGVVDGVPAPTRTPASIVSSKFPDRQGT